EALDRLNAGKSAFVLPFGKGGARAIVGSTRIAAAAPSSADGWRLVKAVVDWRIAVRTAVAKWASLAAEFGIETIGSDVEAEFRQIASLQDLIEATHKLVFDFDAQLLTRLSEVFGRESA